MLCLGYQSARVKSWLFMHIFKSKHSSTKLMNYVDPEKNVIFLKRDFKSHKTVFEKRFSIFMYSLISKRFDKVTKLWYVSEMSIIMPKFKINFSQNHIFRKSKMSRKLLYEFVSKTFAHFFPPRKYVIILQ